MIFVLSSVLLPILFGALLLLKPIEDRHTRNVITESVVIVNTVLAMFAIFTAHGDVIYLLSLYDKVNLVMRIDGLGMVFGTMVALLWPLATLYAFEYMTHETRENTFFAFYTMTYGVTLGIAFSGNMMTMYLFYEMLTLVTIPLVMHTLTLKARQAGKIYAYYSIGGAAFAFTSLIFITVYGNGGLFTIGGIMDHTAASLFSLRLVYVMAFFGFGVKAAIFPLHGWLIRASVAPTPVTALLHAVAVVKAGVFAILRLTYYCYDVDILRGSAAQGIVLVMAMVTVIYGSAMAIRENHFKRRLAYSTISNLSYILMAAALMSPLGLVAAMTHMIAHAVSKICAFFVSGTVLVRSGFVFLPTLTGIGYRMKKTFLIFIVSAMSLTGIPLTLGFVGKWQIALAAFSEGDIRGYGVIFTLFLAALMSCIYMFTIVIRVYSPEKEDEHLLPENLTDPGFRMLIPLACFAAAILILGVHSGWLIRFFEQIAAGAI